MKIQKYPVCLAIAALFSLVSPATAFPGAQDPGFSCYVEHLAERGNMAVMKDGRVVVFGEVADEYGFDGDLKIFRYLSSGAKDTSFAGGSVTLDRALFDHDDEEEDLNLTTSALAVQPDGKVLVSVIYRDGPDVADSFLFRFNANGSLDRSFGENGRVKDDQYSFTSHIIALEDGKILLGGSKGTYWGWQGIGVKRLNSDGSEDSTFSGNSQTFEPGTLANTAFSSMALQPDGKIVVAGYTYDGNYSESVEMDSFVMRLTAAGALDSTFDGDGFRVTVHPKQDYPVDVRIQPDGKILLASVIVRDPNADSHGRQIEACLTRYTSTGALDTSFLGGGVVSYYLGKSEVASMLLQKDGKILLVGTFRVSILDSNITMMRFTSNGSIDKTFGKDGLAMTDYGWTGESKYGWDRSSGDVTHTAEILPSGKVLVLGYAYAGTILNRFSILVQTDARVGPRSSATLGNNIYNSTGVGQTVSLAINRATAKKKSGKTAYVRIQNDGTTAQPFFVKGGAGNKDFVVKYLSGKKNVTDKVVSGKYVTPSLPPGASHLIKVQVTAKTKEKKKSVSLKIIGRAYTDLGSSDQVLVNVISK